MRTGLLLAALLGASLGACGDVPSGDPGKSVRTSRFGEALPQTVAAGPKGSKHWLRALVSDYAEPDPRDAPKRIENLTSFGDCTFAAPAPGDKVALVTTSRVETPGPIFTIEQPDVIRRAEVLASRWRKEGTDTASTEADAAADNFPVAEVVVTDTSAPVYLVLAANEKVLWNIHMAGGAKLARVAIVAGRGAAIANAPADVAIATMSRQQAQECKAVPFRRPGPGWDIVEDAKTDAASRSAVASREASHETFDRWFRATFSRGSDEVAIGAEKASNFLVGPPPADRVPYKTLAGAVVKITPVSNLVFGTRSDYEAKNDQLVRAQAAQFAGGSATTTASVDRETNGTWKGKWDVVNVDGRAQSAALDALANPGRLSDARSVRVTQILSIDELAGETSAGRDDADTMAIVRAPVIARQECDVIETIFAAKCVVAATSARRVGDRIYGVEMTLSFTPKLDLGRVAEGGKLSYLEIQKDLIAQGSSVPRTGQASTRRGMYAEAVSACVRLRQENGNCGLLALRIDAGSRNGRDVEIQGVATMAMLQAGSAQR